MVRTKPVILTMISVAIGLILAVPLWWYSPGPEWLARTTAKDYAERYAPEYSAHMMIGEGKVSHRFVGPIYVCYPSWTVAMFREEDAEQQGPALRLELNDGVFPVWVEEAGWWATEEMDWPDYELPVRG